MTVETTDERYIRLLTKLAVSPQPISTTPEDTDDDLQAYSELAQSDKIEGSGTLGPMGEIVHVGAMRITIEGREYLKELQKRKSLSTSIGLIKENRFPILKWIFGIVAAVIGALLIAWLTKAFLLTKEGN
jgi:hypothetical protein